MFAVFALIGYLYSLPLLRLIGWGLGLVWSRGGLFLLFSSCVFSVVLGSIKYNFITVL